MKIVQQTRVFVPSNEPQNWAETLIGRVFKPLTAEFADSIDWFWFSRYGVPADDSGDCDIAQIPTEYKQGGLHRSLRFRFSISDDRQVDFEKRGRELINANGYRVSDFRDYDFIENLGDRRFLGPENQQPGRGEMRADLVVRFLMAVSRLVIDALVGPDGNDRYHIESNEDAANNPQGSVFQSLFHLFCNITDAPTAVRIYHRLPLFGYGTFMYAPDPPPGGWSGFVDFPIRY